jgi:isopenicillin N synthase-like dioxygenase
MNHIKILEMSGPRFAEVFTHEIMTVGLCGVRAPALTPKIIRNLESVSWEFFRLPQYVKEQVAMPQAGLAWRGYFSTGTELTAGKPDLKEGCYFGVDHGPTHPLVLNKEPMHGGNLWLDDSAGDLGLRMRSAVTSHQRLMRQIADELLLALAQGLRLGKATFLPYVQPEPTELFRIFHYPPQTDHGHLGSEWGVAEHTDMGFLTLLLQEGQTTALEVKTRDGRWCPVPPQTGALYINIGDMLEYVTRGLLWATPHRVRKSGVQGRLSFPYFFDPAWSSRVQPLPLKDLAQAGWHPEHLALRAQHDRWDRLKLHDLGTFSYGQFVWQKIRYVFPWLADLVASEA